MEGVSSSSSVAPKPTVGILSIGEMGLGVAKLLRAHDFPVATVASGRSSSTISRVQAAKIMLLANDSELVSQADIILSIVPPRDAVATARRIAEACRSSAGITARNVRRGTTAAPLNLAYVDFNAISPNTVNMISGLLCPKSPDPTRPKTLRRRSSLLARFSSAPDAEPPPEPIPITFIDGAIIGPPPSQHPDTKEWTLPSLVLSGPSLPAALSADLPRILNVTQISDRMGAASTLKSCFSSLTKGLTALSVLSFSTAQSASVLPHLSSHLEKYSPATMSLISRSLPPMPHKARRWIEEMRQIGDTFSETGGLAEGRAVFDEFANLYQLVAEETELGRERKRARSVEDVASGVENAVRKRRRQGEDGEDLNLAWRGSWS